MASLVRNPPRADGFEVEVVVVDNSPWSPAIRGVIHNYWNMTPFNLDFLANYKTNKFHASALDCVVEHYKFDYLVALETDVLVCRPGWLQWFADQMRPTDYAVGAWHHEQFVNPSCTLYRGQVLRDMMLWCRTHPCPDELRWGPNFERSAPLDNNLPLVENPAVALRDIKGWLAGPFAEKRGWPAGTRLWETPSGQEKGPGWYEPGQQLHHWAVECGWTYTVCPTMTTHMEPGLPVQTLYGKWGVPERTQRYPGDVGSQCRLGCGDDALDPRRQLEANELPLHCHTAHLWGGTRALDILKHPVNDEFIRSHTPMWLAREARYWRDVVPSEVRARTLDLIRQYGWYYRGQGSDHVTERDKEAAEYVRQCYAAGGVTW